MFILSHPLHDGWLLRPLSGVNLRYCISEKAFANNVVPSCIIKSKGKYLYFMALR